MENQATLPRLSHIDEKWSNRKKKPLHDMALSRQIKKCQIADKQLLGISFRDPVGIQTQDLQNRNLTLYSAKLRGQKQGFTV